jgi:hypothetical protein
MIIFGLVAFAIFLFLIVFLPAHSPREILTNVSIAAAGATVLLQLVYEKYRPNNGDSADNIKPIFWSKLYEFQTMRRTKKLAVVFVTMILPLLIAKFFDL